MGGVGFGLQKLAANYVSGFVILAERSLRIGDLVKVDNFEVASPTSTPATPYCAPLAGVKPLCPTKC